MKILCNILYKETYLTLRLAHLLLTAGKTELCDSYHAVHRKRDDKTGGVRVTQLPLNLMRSLGNF
jgi:hypothetical protein